MMMRAALGVALMLMLGGSICNAQEAAQEESATTDTSSTVEQSNPSLLDGLSNDDSLRAAAERIRKEQQFSKLRKERRDILEEIPKVKSEVDALQTQVSILKTERTDLQKKMSVLNMNEFDVESSRLKSRLESEEKRLELLQKQKSATPAPPADQPANELDSLSLAIMDSQSSIDFFTSRITEIEEEKQIKETEREVTDKRLKEIESQMPVLENSLTEKTRMLTELQEKQFLVEDAINVLLIPETARNEFKLLIAGAFSILVGCVILGFFLVAWRDETVRRAIFSSQSGIQFLTLFSLVIAIILFGITEVLEGKELAALLGGLSGYILGRVTTT